MTRYILTRIVRSLVSIICVVSIVFVMIYALVPVERVFKGDQTIQKLLGKPDALADYKNSTLERLGYIDYVVQKDVCAANYSDSYDACMAPKSAQVLEWASNHPEYTVSFNVNSNNLMYATKSIPMLQRIGAFYANLIHVDNPNVITDDTNPNLVRKLYLGTDPNGLPALKCSGCNYKYQIYLDSSFPFIHQNILELNLGASYPTNQGYEVFQLITGGQGKYKIKSTNFETGITQRSYLKTHSCSYKTYSTLSSDDTALFSDAYANCASRYTDPSMIQNSAVIGLIAVLLAYAIGIPFGVTLARRKGSRVDKMGIAVITVLTSVPSLALIAMIATLGSIYLKLPDKFAFYGPFNPLSYVLPVLTLFLLNLPGLVTWVRRYMIDQTSADYVKFAYSKGLSRKEVFQNHILKNAMIPIIQGIPTAIVGVISGALITESFFIVPGMGRLLTDSINNFNNPIVIGLTLIFTTISIIGLLLGDILVIRVDPRIQLTNRKGN